MGWSPPCVCVRDLNSVDLFLLRHGIAAERVGGQDHPDRPLTDRGRQRTLDVLRRLRELGFQADVLMSSPYRRALDTAQLAMQAELATSMHIESALAPGGDPWPRLPHAAVRCLWVGHEPDLSTLAAVLIGAPPGSLRLRKAGFCHLRWPVQLKDPRGKAQLQALMRPRLLDPRSV